ncbi:MAG: DUF2304 family protein [bacterium]
MLIQGLIVIAIILIAASIFGQYRANRIALKELIFWTLLWLAIGIVALLPQTINLLADYVGVGRGVDVAIYISLLVIFYIIFRIFVRFDKLEKDISKIVRHLALEEKEPKQKDE